MQGHALALDAWSAYDRSRFAGRALLPCRTDVCRPAPARHALAACVTLSALVGSAHLVALVDVAVFLHSSLNRRNPFPTY